MNPLDFIDAMECLSGGIAVGIVAYFLGFPILVARKILFRMGDIREDEDD